MSTHDMGARDRLWELAQSAWDERRDPLRDPDVEALLLEHPELFAELDRARLAIGGLRVPEDVPMSLDGEASHDAPTAHPGAGAVLIRRAAALLVTAAAAACLVWWSGLGDAGRTEPAPDGTAPHLASAPAMTPPDAPAAARVVSARLTVSVRRPGTGRAVDRAVSERADTRRLIDQPLARGSSPVRDLSMTCSRTRPWMAP